METTKLTPGKFALNYGLILGVIGVLISIITYFTGMMERGEQWPFYIYYVIFAVFIFLTISKFKKQNNGLLTFGEALKVGVATAVISALVTSVFGLILHYIIDPELMDRAMEVAREKLYDNPKMTEEMVDKSVEMMKKFSNPLIGTAIGIGGSAIFGLIYALIGGLVMKKEA
ncbi:hypothetical protein MHTCC0001_13830 [Flavobacteriaceae bacterium MHTCC 0001]